MQEGDAPDQPKVRSASDGGDASHVYIHGYLHKKTRDGRWQKRWFETNGCFLTYYKNKKMAKLLAALNLPQVGEIKMLDMGHPDDVEQSGALFAIALNDREYMLKAAKKEDAEMWVTKLNMLKSNPQNTKEGAEQSSLAAAASGGGGGDAPNAHTKELEAVTHNGQADPNTWSKKKGCGFC